VHAGKEPGHLFCVPILADIVSQTALMQCRDFGIQHWFATLPYLTSIIETGYKIGEILHRFLGRVGPANSLLQPGGIQDNTRPKGAKSILISRHRILMLAKKLLWICMTRAV